MPPVQETSKKIYKNFLCVLEYLIPKSLMLKDLHI